jgi:hypothetical protein
MVVTAEKKEGSASIQQINWGLKTLAEKTFFVFKKERISSLLPH